MQRHLRIDNDALDELDTLAMSLFSVDVPKDLKFPAKGCKVQYKTLRWLKAHFKTAYPQCTFNGEEQSVTVERKSPDEEELEATAEEKIHPAIDPSVLSVP